MIPFFFGPAAEPLFGVYHAPVAGPRRDCGVVLCHPLGQECVRSHRAFARLAEMLALEGFPVLRFDLHGCGDSSGSASGWSLRRWGEDVLTAVGELEHRAGVLRVCLVGLRLGATLALRVAADAPDVAGLVLWDPVVRGKDHLRELVAQHRSWLRGSFARPRGEPRGLEVLGFRLPPGLLAELEELDCLRLETKLCRPLCLLERENLAATGELVLVLRRIGAIVESTRIPGPAFWRSEEDSLDKGWVPRPSLETIARWLVSRFPGEGGPAAAVEPPCERIPPEDVV